MTARDPEAEQGSITQEGAQDEGFDLEALKDVAGFVVRSPTRRPWLAASAFIFVAAAGIAVASTIPNTYNAQVKLLAQRSAVLPALSNPTRAVPRDADDPVRNIGSVVMRRDNLVSLVRENNVVERFYRNRSAALRLKDTVVASLFGPATDDDRLRAIVGTLEKRMQVFALDESSVMINVDWSDPQVAYDLAACVQKHFLDATYDSEVSMIQDAIAVLEDHVKGELDQVDAALADYQRLRAAPAESAAAAPSVASAAVAAAPRPVTAAPKASAAPDPDLTKALDDKRRQIRALQDEGQREKDSLRQQLNQAQLTLTAEHPTVIALKQKLEALDQPSPELAQAKSEENALLSQIAPAEPSGGGGGGYAAPRGTPSAAAAPRVADVLAATAREREDPSLTPARERLAEAIRRYQDVTARIESARLELDIARTAFRYRYSVITPAEMPRGPKRPLGILIGIGSVVGAIVAGLLAAAGADMLAGRILETWQLRRRLKLEVLGELDLPE